jgi:UDP:flavonoid glycosyltransferase YjiC (YdhE family)
LFVTWDGGGNLPPALGIATEVIGRGGAATMLGHAVQRTAIESAGVPFRAFTAGRDYDSAAPRSTLKGVADLTGIFADRGIGRDALALLAEHPMDAVVVDCLLWGAALELADHGVPVTSLVHSQWGYFHRNARGPVGLIARLRGANPLAAEAAVRRTLVTTRPEIEEPGIVLPANALHTGFVWQGVPGAAEVDPARPRVLVSFSTTSFPGQARALQNVLDALAGLPIEAVATTGAVDPSTLRVPEGMRVERRADHGELMGSTRLVIGHGGHATTSRALAHGIPLLVLPMHPLMDQPAIGRAVERIGVGRTLPKSSSSSRIRTAVDDLLRDDATLARARSLGDAIRAGDGAAAAVDALTPMRGSDVAPL